MTLSMILILAVACVVAVGLVLLLTRRSAPLPDYADPDVEEVPLEDFISDSEHHPEHPTGS